MTDRSRLERDIQFLQSTLDKSLFPRNITAEEKERFKGLIMDDLKNKKSKAEAIEQRERIRDQHTHIDAMHVSEVKGRVNYAIISVREDEYRSMLRRFPNRIRVDGGKNVYDFCEFDLGSQKIGVSFCRTPEQGTSKAQSVARNLIEELQPDWILLVGIAGAVPYHEYCLGDVIIADRLHDFRVTAALEGGLRSQDTRGGPMDRDVEKVIAYLPGMSPAALQYWHRARNVRKRKPAESPPVDLNDDHYYGDMSWREAVQRCIRGGHPAGKTRLRPPKMFVGNTASSDTLVTDTKLAQQWKETAKNVCAIEMELAGVYEAVHDSSVKPKLMSVRAISDIVGYKRSPEWTEYACQSSASFAAALVVSV